MKYVYAALFSVCEEGGYAVRFPDLPGTNIQGEDLYEALYLAEVALGEWLAYLTDKKMDIPSATAIKNIKVEAGQFASLIRAELAENAVT